MIKEKKTREVKANGWHDDDHCEQQWGKMLGPLQAEQGDGTTIYCDTLNLSGPGLFMSYGGPSITSASPLNDFTKKIIS